MVKRKYIVTLNEQNERVVQSCDLEEMLKRECVVASIGTWDNNRAILVNWLMQMSAELKILRNTLQIALFHLETILNHQLIPVTNQNLQLIGVVTLCLTCKIMETLAPKLCEFVEYTDKAFTQQQALEMERIVFEKINWNVSPTILMDWIQLLIHDSKCQKSLLLMDYAILDHKFTSFRPSQIAAAIEITLTGNCQSLCRLEYTVADLQNCINLFKPFLMTMKAYDTPEESSSYFIQRHSTCFAKFASDQLVV